MKRLKIVHYGWMRLGEEAKSLFGCSEAFRYSFPSSSPTPEHIVSHPASQSARYSFIRSRSSINMQQQVAFSSFFCMEADSLHFVNFLKLIEIDYICPAKTKIIEAAKF